MTVRSPTFALGNDAASRRKNKAQYADRGATWLFALAVVFALVLGWQHRDAHYLTPEHGLGYALGIAGGGMMLALLLYPLRKRLGFMRRWLPLRHWFRTHMLLGIVGPLCILYHCGFRLGAANSNIALLCMGLMVGSGLVGRFIYGKIHYGLYGQRASLQELLRQIQASKQALLDRHGAGLGEEVFARWRELEIFALQRRDFLGSVVRALAIGGRVRAERKWLLARLAAGKDIGADSRRDIFIQAQTFLAIVKRSAGIGFYERLFSLWHILHMPIFFMLVATGLIHVYAVHMY